MIRDEFTYKPISRQRKYQLRKRKQGRCIICGDKAITSHFCQDHAHKANEMAKSHYHRHLAGDAL